MNSINSDYWGEIFMKQSVNKVDKLSSEIFVHTALNVWFQNTIELHFIKLRSFVFNVYFVSGILSPSLIGFLINVQFLT